MNFPDPHEPTPEFRASLEREIMRAHRSEAAFGEPDHRRRVRIGTIVGLAAGGVFTLTLGLVLGASTGYASAEVIIRERGDTPLPSAPALAVLKNIPPLMFACNSPVIAAQLPPARQQGVPIVDLPPASTKTATTLGGILGVRQVSNGNLLVDDAGHRQVILLDSTLAVQAVVRDSTPGSAASYGPRPVPMMRWLGDSSLLADDQAGSLLVLGPSGQVARAMAPSHPDMLLGLNIYFGAVDDRGRILFGDHISDFTRGIPNAYSNPESSLVVRADLETRRADTLAKLKTPPSAMMVRSGATSVTRFTMDPLPLIDEWAMASDGSIAVLRGHDYHIDWIHADGTTHSTPKLPFDWKRLTDEDKQKLIDSVRDIESPKMALNLGRRRVGPPPAGSEPGRTGGRGSSVGVPIEQGPPVPVEYVPPALKDMFDFYPPVRAKSMIPDLDGNIWILPTSSAQSKAGELVYDVVNVKGEFHRVRVPLGRSVVGFGKAGVVYLISGDKKGGFTLEKTRLPATK
jgi:hypothetical protein